MQSDHNTAEFLDDVLGAAGFDEPEQPQSSGSNGHRPGSFDAVAFLNSHGVRIRTTKSDGGRTIYVLEECPFDSSHKAPDAAVFVEGSGQIGFKCHHNSCINYKWRDVRQRLDPGCYDRKSSGAAASNGSNSRDGRQSSEPVSYEWITAAELAAAKYTLEYDIEDLHVVGQPQITAAEKKALKTNLSIDASISQASGEKFAGKFPVLRKTRVAVMSGESGLAALQETAQRICKAKGIELADLADRWILSSDVPQLDDVQHHLALRSSLADKGIETLYIDPTYLCIPGDDAGNLIKQGRLLRIVGKICQELGVSLTMLHHCKKTVDDPFRPAELSDISWSGFAEWARQWWLLSRRVRYDADRPGHHELWFNVGGSAGHSSLWALNIDEGSPKDPGGRRWQVEVLSAKDARQAAVEAEEKAKSGARDKRHRGKIDAAKDAIANALRSIPGNADTKRRIMERAGCKGVAFDEAWGTLLRTGKLKETEIVRDNGQKYAGFVYEFDS